MYNLVIKLLSTVIYAGMKEASVTEKNIFLFIFISIVSFTIRKKLSKSKKKYNYCPSERYKTLRPIYGFYHICKSYHCNFDYSEVYGQSVKFVILMYMYIYVTTPVIIHKSKFL